MHRKRRVLMVGPYRKYDHSGGISNVLSNYFERGRFDGYDVYYIPTSHPGNKVLKTAVLSGSLVKYTAYLIYKRPELVHIHTASFPSFYRKLIYLLLAIISKRKTILHIHGGRFHEFYARHPKPFRLLISKILNAADTIIVLSESWNGRIKAITENSNIHVLYNPVDTQEFQFSIQRVGMLHKNILYMGQLEPEKGIYDLLEAVPDVLKAEPGAKFVLCGNGDIERLKNICREKGILERIEFCGWVSGQDKIQILAEADLFVLPSHCEGLPVSVIEAMAAGLPVVATRVGGIPDIIEHGINGFLVNVGDTRSLADYIKELLTNNSLRERMGKVNMNKAQQTFDVSVVVNKLCGIYDDLCMK